MNNIKAVVFDFDGTIRDTSIDYLRPSTLEAIRALRKKYKVYLATGRGIHILNYPGLDLKDFDGIICNNGASGYTNDKKLIFEFPFAKHQVETIIDYCTQKNISLTVQTTTNLFSTPAINDYQKAAYAYFDDTPDPVKQYEGESVLLINAYQYAGYDYRELAELADIRIIEGPVTHVDFMLKHVDKYAGIKKMMELDGISGHYMAFGDQENDYLMLKNALISVAVKDKHGSKNVQSIAKYTCEGSAKDGIYEFLKKHQFI